MSLMKRNTCSSTSCVMLGLELVLRGTGRRASTYMVFDNLGCPTLETREVNKISECPEAIDNIKLEQCQHH